MKISIQAENQQIFLGCR